MSRRVILTWYNLSGYTCRSLHDNIFRDQSHSVPLLIQRFNSGGFLLLYFQPFYLGSCENSHELNLCRRNAVLSWFYQPPIVRCASIRLVTNSSLEVYFVTMPSLSRAWSLVSPDQEYFQNSRFIEEVSMSGCSLFIIIRIIVSSYFMKTLHRMRVR